MFQNPTAASDWTEMSVYAFLLGAWFSSSGTPPSVSIADVTGDVLKTFHVSFDIDVLKLDLFLWLVNSP